ncbi:hypothetical protein ACFV1L_06155 [Kitasatospora sp. NPDC059646]|uniref:hypothetical protein n=1 Tax=Kitasatospora sp. NPDC059646 TaxID=3346893 RepID=UPI00368908A1
MTAALDLASCRDSRRTEVAEEISASQILATRVTRSDGVLIIHHKARPAGEFWDIAYGSQLTDDDRSVLEELASQLAQRTGRTVEDLVVKHRRNAWPNPHFPQSPSHTYVRLSLRMVNA